MTARLLLGLLLFFGLGAAAVAAPVLSSVSGTVSSGSAVTLSGSAFGTHATYGSGKLNYGWLTFDSTSAFTESGNAGDNFVTDCIDANCQRDWLLMTTGNKAGSTKWGKRVDLHDTFACNVDGLKKPYSGAASYSNTAFVSFWFSIPHTSSSGKFYRQWSNNGNSSMFWLATGGDDFYLRGSDDANVTLYTSPQQFGDATWQRVDILSVGSTVTTWIVGQNGNAPQWSQTFGPSPSGTFQAVIGSGKDYGAAATDYYGYDDIFIDFTQARVELCNTSTWAARSTCHLQIPTAWSASSIGFTANTGGFSAGSTAYLYVVDSTGAANSNGYAVTVGGGADTTPPAISAPLPSGQQPYGTSSVTLQVTTDENATCRYSTTDVAYASMANTFATTGGTTHQQPGFAVTNGQAYTRYVRCIDGSSNANTTSATINFSVAASPGGPVVRAECANPPAGTVFCADFEEATDTARRAVWDDYDGALDISFLTDPGPSQDVTNTVSHFLSGGDNSSVDLIKVFPSTYDQMYLRYYLYLDAGYDFSWIGHGGGLTAGSRDNLGISGNRPSGADRAEFTLEFDAAGHLHAYSYYRGMYQDCANPVGSCWGDSFPCLSGAGCAPHHVKHSSVSWPAVSPGQWYCVESMLDMGGTTAANLNGTDPNGRFQIWVDGAPLGDYEDLWLRTTAALGIQNLYMAWRAVPSGHGSIGQRYDNIVVSTQRVGCGTSTTDKTAPSVSAYGPSGSVTSPVTLSMTTGENCSARYSPSRVGHLYKNAFSTTGGASHSSSLSLSNGSYTEHYTCLDAGGNISTPVAAQFSVGDSTPPTVSTRAVASNGASLNLTFSENVSVGAGGNGGFSITRSSGVATTVSYASGSGTSTLTYTLSPSIKAGEILSLTYVQPGNGIEDIAGNDLASFSGQPVTNSSTQQYTVSASAGANGSIVPSGPTARSVDYGLPTTFSVTANGGYTASMAGTCGGSPASGTSTFTYTTNLITANCAVTASFADQTPPTPPASLSASPVSNSQINLSWAASTDGVGVVGYNIERCQGAGCVNFAEIQVLTGAGTTFNNTGLAASTLYRYRVRARDAVQYGGYSPIAEATTLAPSAWRVTCNAGAFGVCAPSSQDVTGGQVAHVTVSATDGYRADVTSTCGTSAGGVGTFDYATGPVTADCAITATFAQIFFIAPPNNLRLQW